MPSEAPCRSLFYSRSEELVSRCVECDLAEPESLASLGFCQDPMVLAVKERYHHVTICADVMHINGTAMLVTVSRNIKLGTVEGIQSTSAENLAAAIKSVI